MVLDTCDALDWCVNEARDSCPDAINATLTKVASQAKTDTTAGMDYNNFNNLTLLSALNTVSARSTRMAISMAQSLLESGNKICSEDAVAQLEGIRWLMAQQEGPIDYDADRFEKELANIDDEPLDEPPEPGLVKRDDGDDGDDSNNLQALWSLLGLPVLGIGGGACFQYNWIICKQISQLFRLFKGAEEVLPETNIVRTIMQESAEALSHPIPPDVSWPEYTRRVMEPEKSPEQLIRDWLKNVPQDIEPVPKDVIPQTNYPPEAGYPPNPADGIPVGYSPPGTPSPGPPGPPVPPGPPLPTVAEGAELFRAETYINNIYNFATTGELLQVTVTPSLTEGPNALGNPAWDVVNAAGQRVQTIWRSPESLSPMPGQWASMPSAADQFVRTQANQVTGKLEPVLNSLGEPVVAATSGVLNTLAPVAYAAGEGVAAGEAVIGGLGSMLFRMFSSGSDDSSADTIIFNSRKGMVDIHDAGSDSHNDGENEHDKPDEEQKKSNEDYDKSQEYDGRPHNPSTSIRATSTRHTNPTPTPTQTSIPHSAQETDESKLPSTDQTNVQGTLAQTSMPHSAQETGESTPPGMDQTNVQSTPATPTKSKALPTESLNEIKSTTYITSVVTATQTTLKTMTTSVNQQPSPTENVIPTGTHVSGCKNIQDCPCGRGGPTCQIGALPRECVVGALQIDGMLFMGNSTWDECVAKLQMLEREEAKAWAAAITLPYCLSDDEWEPKDNGKENGGECYLTFQGEEFAKVANVYVRGMLPLQCPTYLQAEFGDKDGDGHWDEYSHGLEQRCRRAADILGQPFLDFAEANHSVVDYWKETFCLLVPCWGKLPFWGDSQGDV